MSTIPKPALDFDAIYREHQEKIFYLCYRMVKGDIELARDLTQETFLKAWNGREKFRGTCKVATWLYSVCVNTVLMHLRAQRCARRKVELTPYFVKCEKGGHEFVEELGVAITPDVVDMIAIKEAIALLPPGQALTVVLHEIHGLEHWEIGKITKTSVGNSKSSLSRGKNNLRESLK